jgi:hypothetical protein
MPPVLLILPKKFPEPRKTPPCKVRNLVAVPSSPPATAGNSRRLHVAALSCSVPASERIVPAFVAAMVLTVKNAVLPPVFFSVAPAKLLSVPVPLNAVALWSRARRCC